MTTVTFQNHTINVDGSYYWSVAANWVGGSPPAVNDSVSFTVGTYISTVDTGYTSVTLDTLNAIPTGVTLHLQESVTFTDLAAQVGGSVTSTNGALLRVINELTSDLGSLNGDGSLTIELSSTASPFSLALDQVNLFIDGAMNTSTTTPTIINNALLSVGDSITGGLFQSSSGTIGYATGIEGSTAGTDIQLDTSGIVVLTNPSDTTGGLIQGTSAGAAYSCVVLNTDTPGAIYGTQIGTASNPWLLANDAMLFQHSVGSDPYMYTYASTSGPLTIFQSINVEYTITNFFSTDLPITLTPSPFLPLTQTQPVNYVDPFSGETGTYFILGNIAAACFAKGTHILTLGGEVKVEDLKVGDIVVALINGKDKEYHPIRWIGTTASTTISTNNPIRIKKHAFAENKPHRDLLVSPLHALFVDGVLVAAKLLVNDRTIYQDHQFKLDAYYHIELDSHSIIVAEGLETESFLDVGYKYLFKGEGEREHSAHTSVKTWEKDGCAPIIYDQQGADRIKSKLVDRAKLLGYTNRHCAPAAR